jgi:hypothetical protein
MKCLCLHDGELSSSSSYLFRCTGTSMFEWKLTFPKFCSALLQFSPVHISRMHLFLVHFNTILPSITISPNLTFSSNISYSLLVPLSEYGVLKYFLRLQNGQLKSTSRYCTAVWSDTTNKQTKSSEVRTHVTCLKGKKCT